MLLSFNQVGDSFGLIAGLAVWLVLPGWQSRQLHRVAAQAAQAQAQHLREITVRCLAAYNHAKPNQFCHATP